MNDKPYASYEKTVKATMVETTHTVRIQLGETCAEVRETLKLVPGCARCVWIMGDDEGDFPNAGELGFVSESEEAP